MAMFDKARRKYNKSDINSEKEQFIVEQFAQLKSVTEVTELYNEKFPENRLTSPTIRYYKETRAPIIEELKERLIIKSMNIPIANEKIRLKRTEDLYNAAAHVVARKDRHVLSAVETSLKCLKEAREEIKGESGSVQNFLQLNQYNELNDEQLLDKKRELEHKFLELSKKGDVYGER